MCLGAVGQVVEVGDAGLLEVRAADRLLRASLMATEEPVATGDWVLVHAGLVLARLTEQEATDALEVRATPPG